MSEPQHPPQGAVAAVIGGSRRRGRRWPWWLAVAALVAAGFALWLLYAARQAPAQRYQTAAVQLGNLIVKVSATGNLQPTNQVDVGSELSGTVERVFVDDNDRVTRGQVLAQLDLSRLQDQVARSEAALAQAEAQVAQTRASTREAQLALQRLRGLQQRSQGGFPAEADLSAAEAALGRATDALESFLGIYGDLVDERTGVADAGCLAYFRGRIRQYLEALLSKAGAPRPHKVYVSPRVNAAVFYDLSILNLVLPSKKNLEIGLGLVNASSTYAGLPQAAKWVLSLCMLLGRLEIYTVLVLLVPDFWKK